MIFKRWLNKLIAKIVVSGRVQGVGFRYQVQMKAIEQGINGWVRNNDDGTVSIEAEGTKAQLDNFINSLSTGMNRFVKITNLAVEYVDISKGYRNFQVRY